MAFGITKIGNIAATTPTLVNKWHLWLLLEVEKKIYFNRWRKNPF